MGSISPADANCWVTLITKPSYLPGAIILAHTLDRHQSKYPLVVQYTSSLGEEAIAALNIESKARGRIVPVCVDLLVPRAGHENTSSVAERFGDTYTKLRAFEVYKNGFTKACFLDADMAIFQNPDMLFDIELPGRDWLGANHSCVCNLDKDKWAADSWVKGNCAYTTLAGPDNVFRNDLCDGRSTYTLLNGGMFLFYPSEELWGKILTCFNTSNKLKEYQFPDQDFLADFFRGKWQAMSWKFNALKTMKYWHPTMWSDEKLVVLHYIVDKPWDRKNSPDGIGGHLGRDGETHQWWWDLYEEWAQTQKGSNSTVEETLAKMVGTKKPFDRKIPLGQEPGTLKDVIAYSNGQ